MPDTRRIAASVLAGLVLAGFSALPLAAEPSHGIAMHGEPALPADFAHQPHADPDAPKGGRITFGWQGSFDSLNPFIVRGVWPPGLANTAPGHPALVYESLLTRSPDEPFTLYGLIAETVEVPDERDWVEFTLHPDAAFSDGEPITVDDIVFSLETLRERGRPNHRSYYSKVVEIERVGERGVRFVFADGEDRELPLILGLMPILPSHVMDAESFDRTTLEPVLGSGPYRVARVQAGRSITYARNPDYWGRDLPINRGLYNFDEVRYEYFRDESALFEAFTSGMIDVRAEDDPARWEGGGYNFPAARGGRVVQDTFETGTPKGMLGLVFNTRHEIFSDRRVREALTLLFDFEWANRNLYHGAFARTASYFEGSELSSVGVPADEHERALLSAYPDLVREDVMDGTYQPPSTDGSGRDRRNARAALALLQEAGYAVSDGAMRHEETGRPLRFEVLVTTREQERLVLNYATALRRAGIEMSVRQVDSAQFEQRRKTFEFDMVQFSWPASLSPGNEQYFRWSQAAAEAEGSFNMPGVKEPAVDALIDALLATREREDFVSTVRALDRALISGSYVLPLHHRPEQWVARWSRIGRPDVTALGGYALETWWHEEDGVSDRDRDEQERAQAR